MNEPSAGKLRFEREFVEGLLARATTGSVQSPPDAKSIGLQAAFDRLGQEEAATVARTIAVNSEKGMSSADTIRDVGKIEAAYASQRQQKEREHVRAFLLQSASRLASATLEAGDYLVDAFLPSQTIETFVLSLDLRLSAQMMLRANSASEYAALISKGIVDIELIAKDELGIFDKFTGDGALVLFPPLFSGPDAGLRALRCAQRSIALLDRMFRDRRAIFSMPLADSGLAGGLDYGPVTMLRFCGALTAVGDPVVYACRLGGAPARETYMSDRALSAIRLHASSPPVETSELAFEIKHEPAIICHRVVGNIESTISLRSPNWLPAED